MDNWITNTYDPRRADARNKYPYPFGADEKEKELTWESHCQWAYKNIIGRPKASERYTVEQLEAQGIVGIYKRD